MERHLKRFTDEFERIAEIRRRLERASPHVVIGIGDDATVLAVSSRPQVVSVDAAVEGVHFRRGVIADRDVGYRATAAALSDLAAMGAMPRVVLSSLILPPVLDDAALFAIVDGIGESAAACGATVAGGNLSLGSELSITTTVIGDAGEVSLTRIGARVGDGVFVTGALGGAALAWRLLDAGMRAPEAILRRFARPAPRIEEGRRLVGVATAAIDVSDGLLRDLGHVCDASGVGAEVHAHAVPLEPGLAEAAQPVGLDALTLALTGGEDYELLFTAPEAASLPFAATRIGTIVATGGVRVLDADGRALPVPPATGHDHFRAR